MREPSIISNPEFLTHSYVPEKLLIRDKERARLLVCLANGINTLVYGPVGSGKTALLKSVIEQFNSANQTEAIYVDGVLHQTTNSVLKEVAAALNPLDAIPKSNSSLIDRLKKRARGKIVCIDHFERLKQVDAVDKLLRLGLGLVLVADNKESFSRLSKHAKSEIAHTLRIPRYTLSHIYEILLERAELALKPGSCGKAVIKEISKRSEGNMTLALSLLKASAARVEGVKGGRILITDITDCAGDEPKLGEDERILYQILKKHKRLPSSKLHRLYCERARHPKSQRSIRKYLQSLTTKRLLRAVGAKRWRFYELGGSGNG